MIFSVERISSSWFLLATSSISHFVNGDRNKRTRRIRYWTHWSSVLKRFRVNVSCLSHPRFLILSMETGERESIQLAIELINLQCWKDFEFMFVPYHILDFSICHWRQEQEKRRISNGNHWSSVLKRFRVHDSCLPHPRFLILPLETGARESVEWARELNDLQFWNNLEFMFLACHILDFSYCHWRQEQEKA